MSPTRSNIISCVGRYTLAIVGTHQLVIYAMTVLMPELWDGNIILGVVPQVIIIMFEIPVIYFIDKFLTFLVGKGTKK